MLVAFSFQAKAGKEKELESLLDDPDMARRACRALGATRNTLFFGHGRLIRILEFPEGARPRSLLDAAREDPEFGAFLQRVGALAEGGYDLARPETLDAFNARALHPLVLDVRP